MSKRIIFLGALLLLAVRFVTAQPASTPSDGRQRIEQQIRVYVTAFSLDEQQAQQFGNLYKAYCKQMRAVQVQYQISPAERDLPLTDEQIEKRILNNFAQSRAILDVREQYYKEFRSLLSPSQVNTIFEDEKARRARMKR